MTDQRDHRYALALEEARRTIDQQKVDLDSVRSRSAALLGFAGLAASFIGGLALRDDAELSPWTFVGVGAFVGIAACAIVIHWPRKLIFAQRSTTILEWLDANESTASMRHLHRDLVEHLASHYSRNQRKISGMYLIKLMVTALTTPLAVVGRRGQRAADEAVAKGAMRSSMGIEVLRPESHGRRR